MKKLKPVIDDGMLFFQDEDGQLYQAEVEQMNIIEPVQLTKIIEDADE